MNKKIILYIGFFMALLTSCRKDDGNVFNEPPQERMAKVLTNFETALKSGDGWVFYVFTQLDDQGYSFYTQFKDSNRVNMLSDLDSVSANVLKQSSYRTQWMQQPSLIFDTYNYLHRLQDPMPTAGDVGGSAGSGLISDFSFGLTEAAIDSLNKDPKQATQLPMIGRFNGLNVRLYKTSPSEALFWKSGGIWKLQNSIENFINTLDYPGALYSSGNPVQIDFGDKNISFSWIEGTSAHNATVGFAYGYNKIVLEDSISMFGSTLTGFSWTNSTLMLNFLDKSVPVTDAESPIIPLQYTIGGALTTITNTTTVLTGTSSDFTTRRTNTSNALYATPYRLILTNMVFKFDAKGKSMLLTATVPQSGTNYFATFPYAYTKSSDGKFKFTLDKSGINGNASITYAAWSQLLDDRINVDTFVIQYVKAASGVWLGQFVSVEHPDFSFSGTVQ